MRYTMRRLAGISIGLVVTVSLVVSASLVAAPVQPANAANGADFNPGFIISDGVFYDSKTMTAAQIQSFLNAKVPSCTSGYTCLRSYRETTASQTAKNEGCAAYAGQASESAAAIIFKVGVSCGINPKVFLALLEKEQGLVTGTHPTASIYRKATGFGCPDTSVCDSQYYGFFNQVYQAAWMFKKYQARPASRGYVAGRYNTIAWSPNSACGSSSVYIQNQATAGLYLYTPYRPNAAALANMYGTGNSCSTYGNRNFWRLFTDWFGSTGSLATSASLASLDTTTSGLLGPAINSPISYPDGGIGQAFKYGWAYWHKTTGAFYTAANVGRSYIALRGPGGVLGYPIANPRVEPNSGASQAFQKGWLYYSPTTSIHVVSGPVGWSYAALGGPAGVLGFPIQAARAEPNGGASQAFQTGALYWSPTTSIHRLSGTIASSYAALGGPSGVLGFPLAAAVTGPTSDVSQLFQKGTMYSSPTQGAEYVLAALNDEYLKVGGVAGRFGEPIENTTTYPDGGQGQHFRNGWLYWSAATGLDDVAGVIGQAYEKLGGPGGLLGYPIAGETAEPNGGARQAFQNGTLYSSPTLGSFYILNALNAAYLRVGGSGGASGHPIANTVTYPDGGQGQRFQNGWLYLSAATGLDAVTGRIGLSYAALGGPAGRLGYPVTAQKAEPNGGLSQAFQKGTLYWSPKLGLHYVLKPLADEYLKAGGVGGTYGHPTGSTTVYPDGGQGQKFLRGWLYYSAATGLDAVTGRIGLSYSALGGPAGRLGYPVTAQKAEPNRGLSQAFQKGSLYWSPTLGIHYVLKPIADEYVRTGGVKGVYGHPTDSTKVYRDGGSSQRFQKAWLYWSTATGYDVTAGTVGASYAVLGGPDGMLGYPLAAARSESKGGLSQEFTNGWLVWSSVTSIDRVAREIGVYYYSVGGPGGKLGYPLGSTKLVKAGVLEQLFQGGRVRWTIEGGTVRF
jgi:uncharacterized protein with LGFP repeats